MVHSRTHLVTCIHIDMSFIKLQTPSFSLCLPLWRIQYFVFNFYSHKQVLSLCSSDFLQLQLHNQSC